MCSKYCDQDLETISPTIYEKLLQAQIPKAQKETDDLSDFLRFWDLHP